MTPKEKAQELVSKYIHLTKQTTGANGTIYNSKQCALIAVDELIYETQFEVPNIRQRWWFEVKKEIENL
jgi:hypothetical protein